MTHRLVLTVTAVAVLAGGAGIASATTSSRLSHAPAAVTTSAPEHQFCLLLYRDTSPNPQHICINW